MSPEDAILYFAYGSNMSTVRLQQRIADAHPLGAAVLKNYVFRCNKKSSSGSNKGNIAPQNGETTWGVLFELPTNQIANLDKIEKGYKRIKVNVSIGGQAVECETYLSMEISTDLPTKSYMDFIIEGAREHKLPQDYIATMSQIQVKEDN